MSTPRALARLVILCVVYWLVVLTIAGLLLATWRVTVRANQHALPHAFEADVAMWGGVTVAIRARSLEACEAARRAAIKKLLQEAAGVIAYTIDDACTPSASPRTPKRGELLSER